MSKKTVVCMVAALILASVHLVEAQQGNIYRVGLLAPPGKVEERAHIKGLRDGLKEAGYLAGKNLLLDMPNVKTYDELRPIARGYAEKKVNIIVTQGGTATGIAKEATKEIPIVFIWGIPDPVQVGFVKSVARPETNITGVSSFSGPDIFGKRLELFKEAVSSLRRVAVLYNARGEVPGREKSLAVVREAAPNLGLKLIEKPAKSVSDVDEALRTLSKQTVDGIFIIQSGLFAEPCKRIAAIAMQKRLPLSGCEGAEQGVLLSYVPDGYRTGHRGAWYVDRILKGTKPQDLPVEAPMKFELIINLKAAKQIGLTIPPNVLARADKVIK